MKLHVRYSGVAQQAFQACLSWLQRFKPWRTCLVFCHTHVCNALHACITCPSFFDILERLEAPKPACNSLLQFGVYYTLTSLNAAWQHVNRVGQPRLHPVWRQLLTRHGRRPQRGRPSALCKLVALWLQFGIRAPQQVLAHVAFVAGQTRH